MALINKQKKVKFHPQHSNASTSVSPQTEKTKYKNPSPNKTQLSIRGRSSRLSDQQLTGLLIVVNIRFLSVLCYTSRSRPAPII